MRTISRFRLRDSMKELANRVTPVSIHTLFLLLLLLNYQKTIIFSSFEYID